MNEESRLLRKRRGWLRYNGHFWASRLATLGAGRRLGRSVIIDLQAIPFGIWAAAILGSKVEDRGGVAFMRLLPTAVNPILAGGRIPLAEERHCVLK